MLLEKIKSDLESAKKGGNTFLCDVLKLVLTEIGYSQVNSRETVLQDADVVKVLFKEAKKRKDAIEIYTKIGNSEKASAESKELGIIEAYLPTLMSEAETASEVQKVAEETGLNSGRLMGAVMAKLRGKVDAGLVQKIVSEKYS